LTLIRAHLDEIAAGEGDSTRRLPLVSRDELGQLAGSFNAFIEKIHSLVSQIVAMSEQLNGSVSRVADQSRQIDRAMDKQRQETDQVAAAINQMSAAARSVGQCTKCCRGSRRDRQTVPKSQANCRWQHLSNSGIDR
jgi:methyl-accepting chemotaxis protein